MKSNPRTTIIIRDMPFCVRDGFSDLVSKPEDDFSTENGSIISEVGPPTTTKIAAYGKPFIAYTLRQSRKYKLPGHLFGKAHIGEAFTALQPVPFQLPAVGSRITLNPRIPHALREIMALYKFVQADVVWFIKVPAPLGTGIMFRAFAPEFDITTETRGVRVRPMSAPTIALKMGWSNDVSVVPLDTGRIGQSGLSLIIETVEDNSIETVNTPLHAFAYCCVYNIHVSGFIKNMTATEVPGLNFIPKVNALDIIAERGINLDGEVLEFHSEEVSADSSNLVSENISSETGTEGNITTLVEKPAAKAQKPRTNTAMTKNQTGVLNATWMNWRQVTLDSATIGVQQELTLNPYNFDQKGESFNKAWKRNVWHSGNAFKGYVSTVDIKIAIPRPPQISGLVEIYDSNNSSSRTIIAFGETKEISLIPRHFANTPLKPVRYANNPWLRTNECSVTMVYRILVINRTADIADVRIQLMARPGGSVFSAPTKPKPTVPRNLRWLGRRIDLQHEVLDLHCDSGEESHNVDTTHYIAPMAGDMCEAGENNATDGFDEHLDQDEFWVQVWSGMVPVGQQIAVPINLSLISDGLGDGLINPINEKFERFAHIQPTSAGVFGPSVGSYQIKARLPTDVVVDIHHLMLPADMNDEVVVAVFGLSSILAMATGALQPLGGAFLTGAVNAGRNIVSNLVSKLVGGVNNVEAPKEQPSAEPNVFGGSFDLSRFINFLKPILANEIEEPTMGSILLMAKDLFSSLSGRAITEIPVQILIRMDKHSCERTVYNRATVPIDENVNEIWIPKDRYSYIVDQFVANPNTFVFGSELNIMFTKFMLTLEQYLGEPSVNLKEVLEHSYTVDDMDRFLAIQQGHLFTRAEWEDREEAVSANME